jgi:hypothetical protein
MVFEKSAKIFRRKLTKIAENCAHNIDPLLHPFSHVLRECVEEEVPAEELVMGDIIFMKAGDIVPADCRILESNGFTVDNSVITGESEPYELVSFGVGFFGQLPQGLLLLMRPYLFFGDFFKFKFAHIYMPCCNTWIVG